MKVIFMGTPEFAVPSLNALINSNHQAVSVFTQKPKTKGRGLQVGCSPVFQVAKDNNIPIYTPNTLKNIEIQKTIDDIDADIIVVVAYGLIIPKPVLESKRCLNIHPSMLPRFRGAAPLQHTIISGDTETAVCIMQMDEGLDTGDILLQEEITIDHTITFTQLHDQAANIGAKLLIKVLDNLDDIHATPQSDKGLTYAHKLTKEDGRIDWSQSAFTIDCKIRGMNPWPGTFFEYNKECIKILDSTFTTESHSYAPGTVVDHNLSIACGEGILNIKMLQRPGKMGMKTSDFLKGYAIKQGVSVS